MSLSDYKDNRKKVRGAYFIATVSITMVLLIFGYTVLIMINGKKLSDYIKENISFTVYINKKASEAEVSRLEKYLKAQDYAGKVKFISKDEATAIMQEELGSDFYALPDVNIFPSSLEVILNSEFANTDSVEVIRKNLIKYTAVGEIYYQASMVEDINDNVGKMSIVGLVFTVLLLIITISLINNTIRLSVYSKRKFIKLASLLGAKKSFIRNPFVSSAIASGLLAGSLSSLMVVVSVILMRKNFSQIIYITGEYTTVVAIMIFGVIITGLSAYFATNKFLKLNSNNSIF